MGPSDPETCQQKIKLFKFICTASLAIKSLWKPRTTSTDKETLNRKKPCAGPHSKGKGANSTVTLILTQTFFDLSVIFISEKWNILTKIFSKSKNLRLMFWLWTFFKSLMHNLMYLRRMVFKDRWKGAEPIRHRCGSRLGIENRWAATVDELDKTHKDEATTKLPRQYSAISAQTVTNRQ